MKFTVYELPKAKFDKDRIFEWLFQRSPQGTAGWLSAYDEMIERLQGAADIFPVAPENGNLDLEVRQILFKTKRGRVYRAIFHVAGFDVYVLRVRGPGQGPISEELLQ